MKRPGRRLVVVAMIAGAALLGAGTALARYNTDTPTTVTGTANTTSMQTVTAIALTGGDSPSASLMPGSTADVIVRVSNPNAFAVTIFAVAGNGAITADSGHSACATTGVTFADQTNRSDAVPASGQALVHLSAAASMSAASVNACQGATFTIPVSVTARR